MDSVDDCWLPDTSQLRDEVGDGNIKLQIVCGADYLESFNIKDLWSHDDVGYLNANRKMGDMMKIFLRFHFNKWLVWYCF